VSQGQSIWSQRYRVICVNVLKVLEKRAFEQGKITRVNKAIMQKLHIVFCGRRPNRVVPAKRELLVVSWHSRLRPDNARDHRAVEKV
jgi:hypothetical protein